MFFDTHFSVWHLCLEFSGQGWFLNSVCLLSPLTWLALNNIQQSIFFNKGLLYVSVAQRLPWLRLKCVPCWALAECFVIIHHMMISKEAGLAWGLFDPSVSSSISYCKDNYSAVKMTNFFCFGFCTLNAALQIFKQILLAKTKWVRSTAGFLHSKNCLDSNKINVCFRTFRKIRIYDMQIWICTLQC